jgi:hypothetical protein
MTMCDVMCDFETWFFLEFGSKSEDRRPVSCNDDVF